MPQFTDAEEAVLKRLIAGESVLRTLIAEEAVLQTLIPIAQSMVRLARHETQTNGHTRGLIARFQDGSTVSLPPPAMVDGQDSGPYFRQGWVAMDAAIVSGAVEIQTPGQ